MNLGYKIRKSFFPKYFQKYLKNNYVDLIKRCSEDDIEFIMKDVLSIYKYNCNFMDKNSYKFINYISDFLCIFPDRAHELIKINYFREKFINNISCFGKLFDKLNDDKILEVVNEETLNYILNNDDCVNSLSVLLFKDDNMRFDNEKINCFFCNYIINFFDNKSNLDILLYLKCMNLLLLIDKNNSFESRIIEQMKKNNVDKEFLLCMSNDNINKLIKNDYFYNVFINNISIVLKNIEEKKYILPLELLDDDKFINFFVSNSSAVSYRHDVNILKENNIEFYKKIEDCRKKSVINKFKNCNKNSDKYQKNEIFYLFIDTFFNMDAEDFIHDLSMIINYVLNNSDLIQLKRLNQYKKIMNFFKLNNIEEFISSFSLDVDYEAMFISDFNMCFKDSCKKINNSLLNINSVKSGNGVEVFNFDSNSDINVVMLDGMSFNSLIHCIKLGINEESDKSRLFCKKYWDQDKNTTISLSYIGDKNIGVFKEENVFFGFSDFNVDDVIHISNTDSYSQEDKGTSKYICLYSPGDLLENSEGYNEIFYSNSKNLKISYVGCLLDNSLFCEIKNSCNVKLPGVVRCAKEFNVPVVLINKEKYKKNEFVKFSNNWLQDEFKNNSLRCHYNDIEELINDLDIRTKK